MKTWRLPRRRINGHIEYGTYVSVLGEDARVVHVTSRMDGHDLEYVRLEIDEGSTTVSVALLDPRALGERLIEVASEMGR